jgi:enediyne biosynthesis protein E4
MMNPDCKIYIVLIVLQLMPACQNSNKPSDRPGKPLVSVPAANKDYFQEIGKEIGLDFVHSIGDNDLSNIIESVGGGAAFLDYDQDGYIDLYVCSGTYLKGFSHEDMKGKSSGNHLYRNKQDGTFEDVTKKAGVDGGGAYSMGITIGDYNNDGYPDIYVCNYGPNILYKNNGNGTFTDISKTANIEGNECSVGAVWLDYDNDGLLDLYVGNYLYFDPDYKYAEASDGFPAPNAYDSQQDVLYHNEGNDVFRDVTSAMGIVDTDGRAMGVGAVDYDDDGFVDIYVTNDHTLNYLFRNEGGKRFVDMGTPSGTAFSKAGEATISMSVDFADYNGDGRMDIFKSDDSYCSLYENQGKGIFTDKANFAGISMAAAQFVGWSSSFADYDNDGDEDIFKTNGALKHLYGHQDQLFENIGGGKFKDVSAKRGEYFSQEFVGRGACLGDYDNDGDIDIYIVNLNNAGKFLRNNKGNENSWIQLKLVGKTSNRDGIGARVKVTAGSRTQTSQKRSTTGYLSQNDPRMHFGLAKNKVVDKIEIKWPSGKSQVLEHINSNQVVTIKEP